MDRLDHYRIFTYVIEARSFTIAADRLGISRPSVSVAISNLENRIGARLLHRTTRRVTPTHEGQALYQNCLELLAASERMETMFRPGAEVSGNLTIDVPARIGQAIILPQISAFLSLWPQINLDLRLNDRETDLIGDGVDVAVRMGAIRHAAYAQQTLGAVTQINVASPAYLARHGQPQSPDDLGSHLQVGYRSPTTGRVHDWEWMQGEVRRTRPVPWRLAVNCAEAYIASALNGDGLIQIPAYDVAEAMARGELVALMPHHQPAPLAATLLTALSEKRPARTQVFVDWLIPLLRLRFRSETWP